MSCSDSEVFMESFDNICRVCLSSKHVLIPVRQIYFSHFNENGSLEGINISDVFRKYCNVQMHDTDSKPSNLCKPCISLVYRAYSTFERFMESDRILDSLIGTSFRQNHLNSNYPPEVSISDSGAGSPGHENGIKYEPDYNLGVSHVQGNFFDTSETLITQSESCNTDSKAPCLLDNKPFADFNSIADSKESVCEDEKAEFIILIPETKKSAIGELSTLKKLEEGNVVDSDDKKYVDDKCKARVWDHTYSRVEGQERAKRRTRKRRLPAAKIQKTVCPSKRIPYPVKKFSELKCNVCEDAQFDDIEKVIEHIKEMHPTLKKCIMCPRVLVHPESMIVHVASHSEFGRFTCKKCLLVFKSEEAFQSHKASPEHKAPFSCDMCGKLFTLRTTWRVHNQVIHKKGPREFFQCWICGLVLKWARNYKGHLRSHKIYPRDKSHLCEFCAKGFYCNSGLMKHIMAVHKKDDNSNREVKHRPRRREAETSEDEKPYKCDYCPKTFRNSGYCFAHRLSHPECDSIECRYCEKVFTKAKDYRDHKQREHSSFVCHICNHGFPNKMCLGAHISLHKGNFKCSFCDASFKTSYRRKVHEYVHTNERPHQCKICGSRFKQMTHLDRHIECLHTEKRFVCNQCGRRCQFESTYKNHLRSHTGVKPFVCPYCLKYFRDTIIRHRHVKRDHPERFQDFLLYKKEHQGEEVKQVESQPENVNSVFINEDETMISAFLCSEDDKNLE